MKKQLLLLLLLLLFTFSNSFSQARKELNFGIIGANYEIPVHKDISIAPGVSTNLDLNWITLYVRGNYYLDNLFEITNESWDVYSGLGLGYAMYNGDADKDNDLDLGLHIGEDGFGMKNGEYILN